MCPGILRAASIYTPCWLEARVSTLHLPALTIPPKYPTPKALAVSNPYNLFMDSQKEKEHGSLHMFQATQQAFLDLA